MDEVLILTSSKDSGGGVAVLDLKTCTPICGNFKNSIADAGGSAACLGSGLSSFGGAGSCGDYLAVAQSKKPTINIYQWCKPQVLYQCHLQEIMVSVAADPSGRYFVGGSKKGWLYLWELSTGALINSWQAHFKSVTRVQFTRCGGYCMSVSEDGMARCWEIMQFVDTSNSLVDGSSATSRRSVTPYRSWSPHTLAVKDFCIIGGTGGPTFRVLSCSLDRSLVLYDVHACPPTGKQVLRISLNGPLESVVCSPTSDLAFAGASNGVIYVVDMSVAAIGISAANATVNSGQGLGGRGDMAGVSGNGVLEGHTRAVTSLVCSLDNTSLVSASEDGSVRVWDMWTRQCLREVQPLNKTAITNCIIALRPELVGLGAAVHKPTLCPLSSLRKYAGSSAGGGSGSSSSSSSSGGGVDSELSLPLLLGARLVGTTACSQPYYTGSSAIQACKGQGPDGVFGRPVSAGIGTGKKEEKKGSFASASHSHSAQEGEEGEDAMDVAGSSKDGKQKGQGKGQGLAQGLGLGPGKVKDFRQGVRSLEEFVSLPSDPMTGSDEEEEGGDEDVAVSGSAGVSAKARTETGAKGGIGASRNTHKKRRTEEGKEAAPVVGVDEGIVTEGKGSGKTKVTKNKAATTTTATAATAPAPAAAKGSQKKGGKK